MRSARTADRDPLDPAPEALWTDVDYVLANAEYQMAHTHYAGDALPVHNPWLGPDQVASWLGAELTLSPRLNTFRVKPFITEWTAHPRLAVDPANPWWRMYLQILLASVQHRLFGQVDAVLLPGGQGTSAGSGA